MDLILCLDAKNGEPVTAGRTISHPGHGHIEILYTLHFSRSEANNGRACFEAISEIWGQNGGAVTSQESPLACAFGAGSGDSTNAITHYFRCTTACFFPEDSPPKRTQFAHW